MYASGWLSGLGGTGEWGYSDRAAVDGIVGNVGGGEGGAVEIAAVVVVVDDDDDDVVAASVAEVMSAVASQ